MEEQLFASQFQLENICEDDNKIIFYTDFLDYTTLKVCFDYLGPGVHKLIYWGSKVDIQSAPETYGKSRSLTPMEEFFMILVRLCLGLLEKDLADCFGHSASGYIAECNMFICL